jgi:hypothetical protein
MAELSRTCTGGKNSVAAPEKPVKNVWRGMLYRNLEDETDTRYRVEGAHRFRGSGRAVEVGDEVVDGARVARDALGLQRVPHPLPYRPLPRPRVRGSVGGGRRHPGPRRGVQAEALGLERGRVERTRGRGCGTPGHG